MMKIRIENLSFISDLIEPLWTPADRSGWPTSWVCLLFDPREWLIESKTLAGDPAWPDIYNNLIKWPTRVPSKWDHAEIDILKTGAQKIYTGSEIAEMTGISERRVRKVAQTKNLGTLVGKRGTGYAYTSRDIGIMIAGGLGANRRGRPPKIATGSQ